jgi:hypothetical protein
LQEPALLCDCRFFPPNFALAIKFRNSGFGTHCSRLDGNECGELDSHRYGLFLLPSTQLPGTPLPSPPAATPHIISDASPKKTCVVNQSLGTQRLRFALVVLFCSGALVVYAAMCKCLGCSGWHTQSLSIRPPHSCPRIMRSPSLATFITSNAALTFDNLQVQCLLLDHLNRSKIYREDWHEPADDR